MQKRNAVSTVAKLFDFENTEGYHQLHSVFKDWLKRGFPKTYEEYESAMLKETMVSEDVITVMWDSLIAEVVKSKLENTAIPVAQPQSSQTPPKSILKKRRHENIIDGTQKKMNSPNQDSFEDCVTLD